ncbi:hypothetical protein HDV06_002921 [Boothiomyces sp. JEL0866]|nr:hypothetical protein HDV06_002921 [Boothiomyces sp. JEL0866]
MNRLTFNQIDLKQFVDQSAITVAKGYSQKIQSIMGVTRLISLVNLAISEYLTVTDDSRIYIVICSVFIVIVDWIVNVIQAAQLFKRNYVADIFLNKLAYDFYILFSYPHFCFYQKVNAQLPAKCQGRIAVHRNLSGSFNSIATLLITFYSSFVVPLPDFGVLYYHVFSLVLSYILSVVDVLYVLHAMYYYMFFCNDFSGTLENWCLVNINKSLIELNLVDGTQTEEATTIVLFDGDYAKNYPPNRSWSYYMLVSLGKVFWLLDYVLALNLIIPYTLIYYKLSRSNLYDGIDSVRIPTIVEGGFLLFVIGKLALSIYRSRQIIKNRDLTSLMVHSLTVDLFVLSSFNHYCFIEDLKGKLGTYKYLYFTYVYTNVQYPAPFVYQLMQADINQDLNNARDPGPNGDGRYIIRDYAPGYYEFYSVLVAFYISAILMICSFVISLGWISLRSGMTGPSEKWLKEQIRTILAPQQSKLRQFF